MTSDRYVESSTEFSFEAAHYFEHFPDGHPNRRLHGHSFRVQITIAGEPNPTTGFICDFAELEKVTVAIRERLDHRLLNDLNDLGPPSLENIAIWIWHQARQRLALTQKVVVFRDSCRQACTYAGPQHAWTKDAKRVASDPKWDGEHVSDLSAAAAVDA